MTETVLAPAAPPRRFQFDWVPDVLLHPRRACANIAAQPGGVWLTPMLILSLTAVLLVLVTGWVKHSTGLTGVIDLPPDFQNYPPEMQAQYQQAMAATSGPVFLYVFPAISALLGVWVGWLLVGGLLHLVLTLLGGRSGTGSVMNIAAWASLPLAIRNVVRLVAVYSSRQLITSPGLSGFAPVGESSFNLYLAAFLALIDIYVIWHFLLLVAGARANNGISRLKAAGSILFTLLLILGAQALISFFMARLGGLTIIRPFF